MKKLILLAFIMSTFIFAMGSSTPYNPDTCNPIHQIGVDL